MKCFILNEDNHQYDMRILVIYKRETEKRAKAILKSYFVDDDEIAFDYDEITSEYYEKLKLFILEVWEMGGTILKSDIIIEDEDYYIKGQVDAWETCLWRLRVFGTITKKRDHRKINFDYENIDRTVRNQESYSEFNEIETGIIRTIGDLIIIRAIDPNYYSDFDPLKDGNLHIERLFKEV